MAPRRVKLRDKEAKAILLSWPNTTKELWPPPEGIGRWIRAQPRDGVHPGPRISAPGAKLFTTQPDGLWAHFKSDVSCDVVAVEVCGTVQNLNDKRSRYMPSSHSLVLNVSKKWAEEEVATRGGGIKSRIAASESLSSIIRGDEIAIPVRYLRVLYALPNEIYKAWGREHTPTGYEYFCPHSSLSTYNTQKMQSFLKGMSIASQFYLDPHRMK